MRALPARRSQVLLMDRRESVSALRRVVYFSARSFAAIQFSRSQAPRLSAELSGEPPNLPEPLKRPPLGGPATLPRLWGGYLLVPLLGCQKVPRHQPEKYTTQGPGVNNPAHDFRRHFLDFSGRPRGNNALASRRDPLSEL